MKYLNEHSFLMERLEQMRLELRKLSCGSGTQSFSSRLKHLGKIINSRSHTARRQTPQEQSAIALGFQTRVKHGEHATTDPVIGNDDVHLQLSSEQRSIRHP